MPTTLEQRYARFTAHEPDPLTEPASASSSELNKRALIFLGLTLVIPGGAQVIAGNRKLGRFGLGVWVTFWVLVVAGLIASFFSISPMLYIATNSVAQLLTVVVLIGLALVWAVLWIDTFRLLGFHRLAPGAKAIVALLTIAGMLVTSGTQIAAALMINSSRTSLSNIFGSGPAIDPVDGRYNFLILGADAGEGREGLRPDSISVASINAKTGKIVLFSIPRNFQNAPFEAGSPLWDIYPSGYDCGDECIVNALYTDVSENHTDLYPGAEDPGAEAMMDAASGILDISIQGYVMLDMGGFSTLIDSMGGITVTTGGWTPHRGVRPDGEWGHAWWAPGTYTFDGDEALGFARSRTWSSDYARIRRQQCVQQAMLDQFDLPTLLTRFESILEAGEDIVVTNIPQRQLATFLSLGAKSQKQPMERLTIGAPDFGDQGDRFSTYPDFDLIHDRVGTMLGDDGTPQSAGAYPVPVLSKTAATSMLAPATITDGDTDIEGDEATGAERGDGSSQDPDNWPEIPLRADGQAFDEDYLMYAEDIGDIAALEMAASTNQYCHPG